MHICYDEVPSLDFSHFSAGGKQKEDFVAKLGEAYQNLGFVTIKNHKLDQNLMDDLFMVVKDFFDLPDQIKEKYEIPEVFGERGYVGKQKETAKGFKVADLKEFFHVGQEIQGNENISYPENIWPEEVEKFKEVTLLVYRSLEEIGKSILRSIALFLNLEENYFADMIYNGNSILRAIHYFPIFEVPQNATRAAEHCDINLITILMSASAEGLQVKRHDGKWIDVKPDKEQIVINVGDMLSRLTNNKLRSTIHRVINPTSEKLGTSRYSIPFFIHPKPYINLSCLSNCIDQEHPKLYSDITADQFLQQRLTENGLKI